MAENTIDQEANGCIYWFTPQDKAKDDEGNDLLGAYFCIVANNGQGITDLCGPYLNVEEAMAACEQSWTNFDFW